MINQKYGNLKILWHTDKLKSLLEKKVTAPIYVRIKPTNKCNHHCFYCSYDPNFEYVLSERLKREDQIPKEKMIEILNDFKEIGVKAITFSGGGEPLIYPFISECLEKTLELGIDLSIITNGQKLDKERAKLLTQAKWVRISMDACDSKTFSKNRNVPEKFFYKLTENIENFAKIKKDYCELGINFVVHERNAHQIFDSAKFFKNLGVNHTKFTPLYSPKDFSKYHAPFKENVMGQIKNARQEFEDDNFEIYDTYENDFNLSSINKRIYSKCSIMQIVPVIGADSTIYFCHDKAYSNAGILGSIKDKSFKDVWFSKESANKFNNFNPQKECAHHCTYDSRNILIRDTINNYGNHINFI
ncbi:MAG: radical SAM protein [Nanoarchaeota archaeon]|nr:radical SAM protein [Nanoarchaeota archaeon]